MKSLLVIPTVLLVFLGCSQPAHAQEQSAVDLAGGYQYSYITNGGGTGFPGGWFASVGGHISPVFAIAGEASGAYKTESMSGSNAGFTISANLQLRLYTFMVGPRLTSRPGTARVFGQFLVGGATLSGSGTATAGDITVSSSGSETYFAFAPGGGVDVKASRHLGLRIFASFQLLNTKSNANEWGKVFETGVGLVWIP